MRRGRIAVALSALALTGVAGGLTGCGSGPEASDDPNAGQEAPFEATVRIYESRYRPATTRILVGGSVTWINRDVRPHTAETGRRYAVDEDDGYFEEVDFDTHTLTWHEPYTVAFHKPGVYEYHCSMHPTMSGTVEVLNRTPPEHLRRSP